MVARVRPGAGGAADGSARSGATSRGTKCGHYGGKPKPRAASVRRPAGSPGSYAAYDLYLQGRYFWNKRTEEGFQRAADYFQQAIERDPSYAPAYAGLADTLGLTSTYYLGLPNELMPKGRTAALKALQLDDTLAEAHTSLALIAENYDYDWQTAGKEFQRAIQLDPGYATAHQWYAEYLSWLGRFDEALAESEKARQLDPLSMIIAADHATSCTTPGNTIAPSRSLVRCSTWTRTPRALQLS